MDSVLSEKNIIGVYRYAYLQWYNFQVNHLEMCKNQIYTDYDVLKEILKQFPM